MGLPINLRYLSAWVPTWHLEAGEARSGLALPAVSPPRDGLAKLQDVHSPPKRQHSKTAKQQTHNCPFLPVFLGLSRVYFHPVWAGTNRRRAGKGQKCPRGRIRIWQPRSVGLRMYGTLNGRGRAGGSPGKTGEGNKGSGQRMTGGGKIHRLEARDQVHRLPGSCWGGGWCTRGAKGGRKVSVSK